MAYCHHRLSFWTQCRGPNNQLVSIGLHNVPSASISFTGPATTLIKLTVLCPRKRGMQIINIMFLFKVIPPIVNLGPNDGKPHSEFSFLDNIIILRKLPVPVDSSNFIDFFFLEFQKLTYEHGSCNLS